MKKIFLLAAVLTLSSMKAQNSTDRNWTVSTDAKVSPSGKRQIVPQVYKVFHLNGMDLKTQLFASPNEKTTPIGSSNHIISFPAPDGSIQRFKVVESSIMEEALQNANPELRTYSLKGVDDVYANGKADWTEFGLHVNIHSVNGDYFLDPYCVGNTSDYIVYYTKDFKKDPASIIPEATANTNSKEAPKKKEEEKVNRPSSSTSVGQNLRTYRCAVACTGEYAVAATGIGSPTKAQVLARIVTSINRVNSVYETEIAVRLVLVATETNVIFTSAGSDPFNGNNNANILISESQSVISATIGSANYDIGHTFSTGGGGLASLGCVCSGSDKAEGITGSPSPVGDPYDIDYVAHEMGHQFRGNHCFNSTSGSCGGGNRNGSTAMEPGSGITIMAYAGLCGTNDLGSNSIPYFHPVSFDEIINFTQSGGGGTCPSVSPTGNQPPVVTSPGNFTIPKATAFCLTGSATDPDGDALTYSWEEVDAGTSGNWNSGNKPFFRSYAPSASPTRYFPYASLILAHTYTNTKGEYVPQTAQTLNFRLTARDNKTGGGGVNYANSVVTVNNSGPFLLTYPNNSGITWYSGGSETITWNVNGTDAAPVSCDTVRILISYNNGNTYSVLNNSTPNNGSALISVPTVTALESFCRIKIEGKGNIFLDVSNNTFEISDQVGLKKISGNNAVNFNAWPNPFSDKVNISAGNLDMSSVVEVKVTDVLGRTLKVNTYYNRSELNEELDLKETSKGIYFIQLSNGNKQAVYRIVKE